MWKESYRIGIDVIDNQHIELFKMVDNLIQATQKPTRMEEYQKVIEFLKNYVVIHFREEEAYQLSIQYEDQTEHKKLHEEFTKAVLRYEKKLIETDYDIRIIKDLAGTLTAWLIYHVANADQKIARKEMVQNETNVMSFLRSFTSSIAEVLSKMVNLDRSKMTGVNISEFETNDCVFVEVGLIGDQEGRAVFCFSNKLAFNLINSMTFMEVNQVDELVCSALAEVSNISSGNAATYMTKKGVACDITTPLVFKEKQDSFGLLKGILIQTGMGNLSVAVEVDSHNPKNK